MQDERQGKPSASGVERLSLCPGSWQLERTLPPLPESEDAASGTRIHRALELNDAEGLNDSETVSFDMCRTLRDETLSLIFTTEDPLTLEEENRLWYSDRFSGKADVIAAATKVAAILDYKTGRREVATAEGNLQLRALAALLESSTLEVFDRIVVGILQPFAKPSVSLCEYNRTNLTKAREWLVGVLDAAENPDAPRIPGEKQCRWCRAKAVCPEAMAAATALPIGSLQLNPEALALTLPSEDLGTFLNHASFAESVIEACRDEAKRRLNAGEEVPGWRLKEGATREVITDPEAVYTRFVQVGGDSTGFMPCVTVAKAKLKDALKKVTGQKGKGLDAELDTLLAGLTDQKQNAPSLERTT